MAGWAFDKEPEYHARRIAGKVGCDLPDQEDLIQCLKDLPAINITLAHSAYIVSSNWYRPFNIPCQFFNMLNAYHTYFVIATVLVFIDNKNREKSAQEAN